MIASIANLFGFLLKFLYDIFNNYGIAIIIFSVLVKIILLPLTIKQQKSMDKTSGLQDEIKNIQFKYKGDQERQNQEIMELYKREKVSPFSGCLSSIIQIILIFSVFYMVRSPLTYMKKVDTALIEDYSKKLEVKTNYPEVEIIKEFGEEDEEVYLNMNFLGLDLNGVPTADIKNIKNMIIPILYVISSIISAKLTLNTTKKMKKTSKENESETDKKEDQAEMLEGTSKTMTYMMPVMAFSISLVAPLGLALYWLMSNILMIIERLVLNYIKTKKEAV